MYTRKPVKELKSLALEAFLKQGLFTPKAIHESPKITVLRDASEQLLRNYVYDIRCKQFKRTNQSLAFFPDEYAKVEWLLDFFPELILRYLDSALFKKINEAINQALQENLITTDELTAMSRSHLVAWFSNSRSPRCIFDGDWAKPAPSRLAILRKKLLTPQQLADIVDGDKLSLLLLFYAEKLSVALDNHWISIADINELSSDHLIALFQNDVGMEVLANKILTIDHMKSFRMELLPTVLAKAFFVVKMIHENIMTIEEMNLLASNALDILLSERGVIVMERRLISVDQIKKIYSIYPSHVYNFDHLLNRDELFKGLINGSPVEEYINKLTFKPGASLVQGESKYEEKLKIQQQPNSEKNSSDEMSLDSDSNLPGDAGSESDADSSGDERYERPSKRRRI